jgi:hypothetical protein
MDKARFDGLARRLAGVTTRRAAVATLAGGLLATKAAPAAEAAWRFCRVPQAICTQDRHCCSRSCVDGACGCIKKGGDCFRLGVACCSGRCRKGRCK